MRSGAQPNGRAARSVAVRSLQLRASYLHVWALLCSVLRKQSSLTALAARTICFMKQALALWPRVADGLHARQQHRVTSFQSCSLNSGGETDGAPEALLWMAATDDVSTTRRTVDLRRRAYRRQRLTIPCVVCNSMTEAKTPIVAAI